VKAKLAGRILVLATLCLAFSLSGALAATVNYTLNDANIAVPAPYGTVAVSLPDGGGTTATLTFTSSVVDGNIYLFGDGGSVAVNVNATSWALGAITGGNGGTGFTPGPWSDGGAGNEDGFGSFNQTINSFNGFTTSADTISFALMNTSGTWANASEVLLPNSDGRSWALTSSSRPRPRTRPTEPS